MNPVASKIEEIDQKGKTTILVIGKTGVGKSTLCNVLTGNDPDSDVFRVSGGALSCTQEVRLHEGNLLGANGQPITIIDTVGFNDPGKDEKSETASLIKTLKARLHHINLFAIVLDGTNPRIDQSQKEMLELFAAVFSESFWENVIIAFTKLSMDQKQIKLRCTKERGDDETWAQRYVADFKKQVGKQLKHVFIDAKHDRADKEEVEAFNDGVRKLEECLNNNVGFKTDAMKEVEMSLEFERQLRIRAESERAAALRSRERAKERAVKLEDELRETKKELLELKERLNEGILFAGTGPEAISESNQAPSEMVTDNGTSITEQRESSTLAHDIKRTRIERNQTTLELYKPKADQKDELDQGDLLVYGEPNEKENRTVVIVGAKNKGKNTFLNSFANYLLEVGREHNFRFKISTADQDKVMTHIMKNTHLVST